MEFEPDDDIDFGFLDDALDPTDTYAKSDAVIFLVDAQAFHFHHEAVEMSNLQIVANAYTSFLKDKLMSPNTDKSSIVFYNTVA